MCRDRTDKLAAITDAAINLVAEAMNDDELPAAKRADMALALLGKAAIKDAAQPAEQEGDIFDVVFVDQNGNEIELYSFRKRLPEAGA